MMDRNSLVFKNMILGIEFDKYIAEHPSFGKKIPKDATIILFSGKDRELNRKNLELAKDSIKKGEKVVLVKIKKMSPLPKSRIEQQPKLDTLAA